MQKYNLKNSVVENVLEQDGGRFNIMFHLLVLKCHLDTSSCTLNQSDYDYNGGGITAFYGIID